MDEYESITKEWKKTDILTPKILILVCGNKKYAVVEDHTNIIVVASKNEIVYAVPKNRVYLVNKEDIPPVYYLEDNKSLKIISCTKETIEKRHKDQFFVINYIIKFL